jgi:hypothetical protein
MRTKLAAANTRKQYTLRSNRNEKANERKQSKRKQKLNTQKEKKTKNKDLDPKQSGRFYRPLMTFTKVFSTEEERKTEHRLQASFNQEDSKTNGEEGYKIQSTRCLSFRRTGVKIK